MRFTALTLHLKARQVAMFIRLAASLADEQGAMGNDAKSRIIRTYQRGRGGNALTAAQPLFEVGWIVLSHG